MTRPRRGLRQTVIFLVILLVAVFGYFPSAAGNTSGTVYIRTVPAMAGVRFAVAGLFATTGTDGSASVSVGNLNGVAGQVHLAGSSVGNGTSVAISKIVPAAHVVGESHLSVGLNVSSQVQLSIDSGLTGVSVSAVHLVRLHSIAGEVRNVNPQLTQQLTLLSRRTRLVGGTLRAQQVTWSVDQVNVGPGVALTTTTPRFDPFGRSAWRLQLQTVHGTVFIRTVPSTPGVAFLLEGATITTGADGTAVAPVADLNNVNTRLRLATAAAGDLQVSNPRVSKLPATKVRERRLVVALDVRRPVKLDFTDLRGQRVPATHITAMQMTVGDAVVKVVGQELEAPALLLTQVATRVGKSWEPRTVNYSLTSVRIDGSEAVFNGRQRFTPSASGTWTVTLAVFSLTVTAHDALFGDRVASRAVITKPDGVKYTVHLGGGSPSVVPSMVRGLYGLTIDSAVMGGHTTLLVSRDDAIDLRVVTLLDAVLVVVVGFMLLVASVVGGRLMARRRATVSAGKRE